ncbi:MAG: hypothetical protein U1E73_05335 [Planctomycetota bacterium]
MSGSSPEPEGLFPVNGKRSLRARASGALASEVGARGGGFVVPSTEQMELMLAGANDVESLVGLEQAVAAVKAFAEHHDAMKSQLAEISAFHMRARRKLGAVLSQTVQRGGDRSKYHCGTLHEGALPKSINGNASRRLQMLAGIPESVFEEFLSKNIEQGRESSLRGAIRLAHQTKGGEAQKQTPKARIDAAPIPDAVIECVSRTLGDIDLCVGPRVLGCCKHVSPAIIKDADLCGIVFVAECHEPERWLPKLKELRTAGKLAQVAVLVAVEPCSAWFRDALQGSWQFGALPGAACLIAHHGRAEAFRAAMHEMGGVAFRA